MLIIFDLDDTLIDTTGSITYHKLEDALISMQEAGLVVPDFSEALALLRRLDSASESGRDTLLEFLEILGADSHFAEVGVQKIYEMSFCDVPISTLEGAEEMLLDLSSCHQLALVSNGIEKRQMDKLKKAGIDSRIFSKIAISEEKCKKSRYQMIVNELGFRSSHVIVCGDRISIDLAPAKELGFKTIQIRWGRGLNAIGMKGDVDYVISSLGEVKSIISHLSSNEFKNWA